MFFGAFVSIALVGRLLGAAGPKSAADLKGPDLKPQAASCDAPREEKIRNAASRLGVARGQALEGLDVIVVVNPFSWSQMSLGSQRALGLAVACEAPGTLGALTVRFRYNRDGEDVLRMPGSELYQLARGTFSSAPAAAAPNALRGVAWGAHPTPNLVRFKDSDYAWVASRAVVRSIGNLRQPGDTRSVPTGLEGVGKDLRSRAPQQRPLAFCGMLL